ncbi:MAG: tRNA-dihydrouridine synthase family protein [Treponema sp.]|nr:tRNA-dihydrouridine synthase family protein [Candidatus Treponema caballi]
MKLCLAPMATLSHEALRRAIALFGECDEYYTEMIHAPSLLHGGQFERFYLLNGPEPDKIVWQLTGTEEDTLGRAASQVAALGGIGVDINMGCSAPEIYKYGAGIAWMLKPLDETRAMVRAVRSAVESASPAAPLRLSVKMRLGDENFTEEKLFAFTDMLLEEDVKQITLHPRTRKEKYTRPPRLQYLASFCNYVKSHAPDVLVVGNGAVKDAESMNRMIKTAPDIDGIMIARAAVQKPWIFAELAGNKASDADKACTPGTRTADLFAIAEQFTSDLQQYQPPEFYETRARRFFSYFSDNFQFGHFLKTQIANTSDRDAQLAVLNDYFNKMPDERYVKY